MGRANNSLATEKSIFQTVSKKEKNFFGTPRVGEPIVLYLAGKKRGGSRWPRKTVWLGEGKPTNQKTKIYGVQRLNPED